MCIKELLHKIRILAPLFELCSLVSSESGMYYVKYVSVSLFTLDMLSTSIVGSDKDF
eukprot:c35565_g1_i1 orf=62-232(-)